MLSQPLRFLHLLIGISAISWVIWLSTLLEKRLLVPVNKSLRHRFYNRYPETETKSLGHEHWVKEPVPKAGIFVKNGWPGFELRFS